ncbi:GGDEF domain-containing response regulator [Roseateles koreensis]|uniref:GGDEF domain-containing response regulator n=1 Tax=Roseateles koreensis TaxID=2987526 RepID=UPI00235921E1|nr:diguanylate cyclase [Roseateles koreensis]
MPDDIEEDALAPVRRSSVLIVDDQAAVLQTLYQLFKDTYEVFVATSGAQALSRAKVNPPDLVLLDMVMPGMTGMEVCRQLKEDPETQNIPVIFLTGNCSVDDEARALDAGAADFISKPFNPRIVSVRVNTQLRLKAKSDLLRRIARTDALTGLGNRRHFNSTLFKEWRRCARNSLPISLVFIDVDFFKRFNDIYGHPMGDYCLSSVASAMKSRMWRPADLLARFGGEEFVCLLPETPLKGAIHKAQELEAAVRDLAISHEGSSVAPVVTISLGVAAALPAQGDDPETLIDAADRMLYESKAGGRGQVRSVEITSA